MKFTEWLLLNMSVTLNELLTFTQNQVMDGVIDDRYDNHQVDNPTEIFTEMK